MALELRASLRPEAEFYSQVTKAWQTKFIVGTHNNMTSTTMMESKYVENKFFSSNIQENMKFPHWNKAYLLVIY